MVTTAGEIQCAHKAGLHLIGEKDKRPVWGASDLRRDIFLLACLQMGISTEFNVEAI